MYYKENHKNNNHKCEGQYSVKVRIYVPGEGYLIYWYYCYAESGNEAIQITKKYILNSIKNQYDTDDEWLIKLCNTIASIVKREGKFFIQNWEYKVIYPGKYGLPYRLYTSSFRKL